MSLIFLALAHLLGIYEVLSLLPSCLQAIFRNPHGLHFRIKSTFDLKSLSFGLSLTLLAVFIALSVP